MTEFGRQALVEEIAELIVGSEPWKYPDGSSQIVWEDMFPAAEKVADLIAGLVAEAKATRGTCWIVQWDYPPLPKEQWYLDRFWPYVEVYAKWGDAERRVAELHARGIATAHYTERRYWAGEGE